MMQTRDYRDYEGSQFSQEKARGHAGMMDASESVWKAALLSLRHRDIRARSPLVTEASLTQSKSRLLDLYDF